MEICHSVMNDFVGHNNCHIKQICYCFSLSFSFLFTLFVSVACVLSVCFFNLADAISSMYLISLQ